MELGKEKQLLNSGLLLTIYEITDRFLTIYKIQYPGSRFIPLKLCKEIIDNRWRFR